MTINNPPPVLPTPQVTTTPEYWEVEGVSLQTFAYNIVSWGSGGRQAPPNLRGNDITIPGRVGDLWRPKVPQSRKITLGMWVQGANPDGSPPSSMSQMQQFEQNWMMLRRLLWNPYRQFTLTKRVYVPAVMQGDAIVPDSYVPVSAQAQFVGGLDPSVIGHGGAAQFTVDLQLADPFFYGAPISVSNSFTTLGDARTHRIMLNAGGTISVRNSHGHGFDYSGVQADFDVHEWQALAPANVAGAVTLVSDGTDDHWLYFDPGAESISGASATYQPAYI